VRILGVEFAGEIAEWRVAHEQAMGILLLDAPAVALAHDLGTRPRRYRRELEFHADPPFAALMVGLPRRHPHFPVAGHVTAPQIASRFLVRHAIRPRPMHCQTLPPGIVRAHGHSLDAAMLIGPN
jgi:hypothetical protein